MSFRSLISQKSQPSDLRRSEAPNEKNTTETTITKRTGGDNLRGHAVQQLTTRAIETKDSKRARATEKHAEAHEATDAQLYRAINAVQKGKATELKEAMQEVVNLLKPVLKRHDTHHLQNAVDARLSEVLPNLSDSELKALASGLTQMKRTHAGGADALIDQLVSSTKSQALSRRADCRATAIKLIREDRPPIRLMSQAKRTELKAAVDLLESSPQQGDPLPDYLTFLSKNIHAADNKSVRPALWAELNKLPMPVRREVEETSTEASEDAVAVSDVAEELIDLASTLEQICQAPIEKKSPPDLQEIRAVGEQVKNNAKRLQTLFQAMADARSAWVTINGKIPANDENVVRAKEEIQEAKDGVDMAAEIAKDAEVQLKRIDAALAKS